MTETTRLELELADALGLTQAVRAAAADAAAHVDAEKLAAKLRAIDADLADIQEEVNAIVVENPRARSQLTRRSRLLRDTETGAQGGRLDGADGLDALQALAAEAAYALVQWKVVRRLAKGVGDDRARALAKRAEPLAQEHLDLAITACDKIAKKQAKAL
ncbi:MAG TPA: hypothetical protein VN238_17385 [Solirubrobacteraceae bacterium]|nr:hypothetical protein [Solirubrobacteraceae bacterium]